MGPRCVALPSLPRLPTSAITVLIVNIVIVITRESTLLTIEIAEARYAASHRVIASALAARLAPIFGASSSPEINRLCDVSTQTTCSTRGSSKVSAIEFDY